jgi:hypothetical protein
MLAVAVQGIGGAGNVNDGTADGATAWTMVQGIGGQVTAGLSRNVSIEGALAFTRASEVEFASGLQARETAGRVLASGLLHTSGPRWMPYGRVALGARIAKHTQSMDAERESRYRASGMFGFGGGLNVMLGKRAMASASLMYLGSLTGDAADGLELGLSLAGVWRIGP